MARPSLTDRQWWLLNAVSAGRQCAIRPIWLRGPYASDRDFIADLKALSAEDMISSATMSQRLYLVAKPTQRGKDWLRKWRKEQAAKSADLLKVGEL